MPAIISAVTNFGAMAADQYLAINTDNVNRATQALASGSRVSNPAYDPASAAVGYSFAANLGAFQQASSNVTQATSMLQMVSSVLGSTQNILTQMSQLSAQANTGTLDSSQLAMLDQTYQKLIGQIDNNASINARWGQTSLLTGGAGTYNSITANQVISVSNPGTAPTNTISGILTAQSQGLISGSPVGATVTDLGDTYKGNTAGATYLVSVQIGNQTFQGTTSPVASANFSLTSTSDPTSVLVMNYSSSIAGVTSAATFQNAINQYLGITTANPLAVTPSSGNTMITAVIQGNPTIGSAMTPGTYAVSYVYDSGSTTGTFRLTNGQQTWTQNVTSQPTNVTFTNGFSMPIQNSWVYTAANVPQYVFTVSANPSSAQSYSFQIGNKATDLVTATFSGAGSVALGLSGTSLTSSSNAASATTAINNAISQASTMIASVGGTYTQLNVIGNNLQSSIQNLAAAKSTFTDTDVAQTMMQLQTSKGLQQIAGTVFTQALQNSSQLAQMVQQGI